MILEEWLLFVRIAFYLKPQKTKPMSQTDSFLLINLNVYCPFVPQSKLSCVSQMSLRKEFLTSLRTLTQGLGREQSDFLGSGYR